MGTVHKVTQNVSADSAIAHCDICDIGSIGGSGYVHTCVESAIVSENVLVLGLEKTLEFLEDTFQYLVSSSDVLFDGTLVLQLFISSQLFGGVEEPSELFQLHSDCAFCFIDFIELRLAWHTLS